MCRVMEEMCNEAAREAAKAKTIEIAQRMLEAGKLSYEEIADMLEINIEEVKALDEGGPV